MWGELSDLFKGHEAARRRRAMKQERMFRTPGEGGLASDRRGERAEVDKPGGHSGDGDDGTWRGVGWSEGGREKTKGGPEVWRPEKGPRRLVPREPGPEEGL